MPTGLGRLLRLVSFEPAHAILADITVDALQLRVFSDSAQLIVLINPAQFLVFVKAPEFFVLVETSQLIVVRKTLHLVQGAIGRLMQSACPAVTRNSSLF
jgi:hypothetical protein